MISTAYAQLKQSNMTDDAKHIALASTQANNMPEYVNDHTEE